MVGFSFGGIYFLTQSFDVPVLPGILARSSVWVFGITRGPFGFLSLPAQLSASVAVKDAFGRRALSEHI